MRLNEKDLLKQCVDQPQYLSKALGHDADAEGGTGLQTLEQKKEMLKYFYKAWSGLSRFIFSQCVNKGVCVDFPLVGRFMARPSATPKEDGDQSQQTLICFVPHIDFLNSGRFSFP
jgi:hypothetical protein